MLVHRLCLPKKCDFLRSTSKHVPDFDNKAPSSPSPKSTINCRSYATENENKILSSIKLLNTPELKSLNAYPLKNKPIPFYKYEFDRYSQDGIKIFRPKDLPPDHPTYLVERIKSKCPKRGKNRYFELVYYDVPIKDEDLDDMVFIEETQKMDFSKMFSAAKNIEELKRFFAKRNISFNQKFVDCFQLKMRDRLPDPVKYNYFRLGKTLIEFQVEHAYISVYPQIDPKLLLLLIQNASGLTTLSKAALNEGLEAFINIQDSQIPDRILNQSEMCMHMARYVYCSVLGVIFEQYGLEKATEYLFNTLSLTRFTKQQIRTLSAVRLNNASEKLEKLLKDLSLPPFYYITVSRPNGHWDVTVNSGKSLLGSGESRKLKRAQKRAAMDALLNYWCKIAHCKNILAKETP